MRGLITHDPFTPTLWHHRSQKVLTSDFDHARLSPRVSLATTKALPTNILYRTPSTQFLSCNLQVQFVKKNVRGGGGGCGGGGGGGGSGGVVDVPINDSPTQS